jgi:hypothetical protein
MFASSGGGYCRVSAESSAWPPSSLSRISRAVEGRDPIIMPIRSVLFLDPVRGDTRYHAMLKKMHLE